MTERRSLLDTALDMLVYAPIGAAVTVGEWLPKLSEKGRDRFGEQTQLARVAGRLAVGEGRRRAVRVAQRLMETGLGSPDAPVPAVPAAHVPAVPATPAGAAPRVTGETADGAGGHDRPVGRPSASDGTEPAGAARTRSAALAIPDYDSLSASQVVARLAGLSPEELEEVRLHETATRARRSVLARIDQLRRGA